MFPNLLALVTLGDTPNNGLEEVEDMTQSRGTYSLTKDDLCANQTRKVPVRPLWAISKTRQILNIRPSVSERLFPSTPYVKWLTPADDALQ